MTYTKEELLKRVNLLRVTLQGKEEEKKSIVQAITDIKKQIQQWEELSEHQTKMF